MPVTLTVAKDAKRFGGARVPPVLVAAYLAVTIGVGGWLTGQWMTGGIDPDSVHPGYFLPTAAGGLIGANAAAQVHLHGLAEASFGIGVIFWVLLSSMILKRLFTGAALVPTMAIELGVASAMRSWSSRCVYPGARSDSAMRSSQSPSRVRSAGVSAVRPG